jgi:hypothetical protein
MLSNVMNETSLLNIRLLPVGWNRYSGSTSESTSIERKPL